MKKRIVCLLLALGMLLGATSGVCAAGTDAGRVDLQGQALPVSAAAAQVEANGNPIAPMATSYAGYMPYVSGLGQACVVGKTMTLRALAYVPTAGVSQNWNVDIYYGEQPTQEGYIDTAVGSFAGQSGYYDLSVDWDTTGQKTGTYTVVYYTTYGSGDNVQAVEDSIVATYVYVEDFEIELNHVYLADFDVDGYPKVEKLCLAKGSSEVTDYFVRFDPERATCQRNVEYSCEESSVLEVDSFGGFLAYDAKEYGDVNLWVFGGFLSVPVAVEICTDTNGHQYSETILKQPTCTEPGEKTKTCSKCGYTTEPMEVPALGHTWDEGKIVKEEPEKEYAEKLYTCTVCGEQETRGGSTCPGAEFTDMPRLTSWAHKGIDYCLANGLMNGMGGGKFQPDGVTTRGQLVTILWRQANSPEPKGAAPFTDLTKSYYQKAIAWAYEQGVAKGITETTFGPEQPVTREQFATFVCRYAERVLGLDVSARADLSKFPDHETVHDYAKASLAWAAAQGLINGVATKDGTVLEPRGNATRAQAATILMRFCQSLEVPETPETPETPENP